MEPTNDDSDSSDEDLEAAEEDTEMPEGTEVPEDEGNNDPSNDRVPGAAILTSFVPLQLVAHYNQGQSVVVFDNELCNSPLSGEFLDCTILQPHKPLVVLLACLLSLLQGKSLETIFLPSITAPKDSATSVSGYLKILFILKTKYLEINSFLPWVITALQHQKKK